MSGDGIDSTAIEARRETGEGRRVRGGRQRRRDSQRGERGRLGDVTRRREGIGRLPLPLYTWGGTGGLMGLTCPWAGPLHGRATSIRDGPKFWAMGQPMGLMPTGNM